MASLSDAEDTEVPDVADTPMSGGGGGGDDDNGESGNDVPVKQSRRVSHTEANLRLEALRAGLLRTTPFDVSPDTLKRLLQTTTRTQLYRWSGAPRTFSALGDILRATVDLGNFNPLSARLSAFPYTGALLNKRLKAVPWSEFIAGIDMYLCPENVTWEYDFSAVGAPQDTPRRVTERGDFFYKSAPPTTRLDPQRLHAALCERNIPGTSATVTYGALIAALYYVMTTSEKTLRHYSRTVRAEEARDASLRQRDCPVSRMEHTFMDVSIVNQALQKVGDRPFTVREGNLELLATIDRRREAGESEINARAGKRRVARRPQRKTTLDDLPDRFEQDNIGRLVSVTQMDERNAWLADIHRISYDKARQADRRNVPSPDVTTSTVTQFLTEWRRSHLRSFVDDARRAGRIPPDTSRDAEPVAGTVMGIFWDVLKPEVLETLPMHAFVYAATFLGWIFSAGHRMRRSVATVLAGISHKLTPMRLQKFFVECFNLNMKRVPLPLERGRVWVTTSTLFNLLATATTSTSSTDFRTGFTDATAGVCTDPSARLLTDDTKHYAGAIHPVGEARNTLNASLLWNMTGSGRMRDMRIVRDMTKQMKAQQSARVRAGRRAAAAAGSDGDEDGGEGEGSASAGSPTRKRAPKRGRLDEDNADGADETASSAAQSAVATTSAQPLITDLRDLLNALVEPSANALCHPLQVALNALSLTDGNDVAARRILGCLTQTKPDDSVWGIMYRRAAAVLRFNGQGSANKLSAKALYKRITQGDSPVHAALRKEATQMCAEWVGLLQLLSIGNWDKLASANDHQRWGMYARLPFSLRSGIDLDAVVPIPTTGFTPRPIQLKRRAIPSLPFAEIFAGGPTTGPSVDPVALLRARVGDGHTLWSTPSADAARVTRAIASNASLFANGGGPDVGNVSRDIGSLYDREVLRRQGTQASIGVPYVFEENLEVAVAEARDKFVDTNTKAMEIQLLRCRTFHAHKRRKVGATGEVEDEAETADGEPVPSPSAGPRLDLKRGVRAHQWLMQSLVRMGYFQLTELKQVANPEFETFIRRILWKQVDFTAVSTMAFLNPSNPNPKACCLTKKDSTMRIRVAIPDTYHGHGLAVEHFVRNTLVYFAAFWRMHYVQAGEAGSKKLTARINTFMPGSMGSKTTKALPPISEDIARELAALNKHEGDEAFIKGILEGKHRRQLSVGKVSVPRWVPQKGQGDNPATYEFVCGNDGKDGRPLCLNHNHILAVRQRHNGRMRFRCGRARGRGFQPGNTAKKAAKKAAAAKAPKAAAPSQRPTKRRRKVVTSSASKDDDDEDDDNSAPSLQSVQGGADVDVDGSDDMELDIVGSESEGEEEEEEEEEDGEEGSDVDMGDSE